ncbi:MAG TPA: DMT family transporter [Victivallales bacterium]|nr:DMT family transporter [Victivallales bacterium]
MNKYKIAITYMLISTLLLSLMFASIKDLLGVYDIMIVIFLRYFIAFLIVTCVIMLSGIKFKISFSTFKKHLLRAFLIVCSQYCMFYYLLHHTILQGNLLFATGPLFIPIISMFILKEKIKPTIWICIILSFMGVILIMKPTSNVFDSAMMIGLLSGFFNACSQLVFHSTAKKENPFVINCWVFGIASVLSFIPMLVFFNIDKIQMQFTNIFHSNIAILFLILPILSISSQNARTHAYKYVKYATSLSPFLYTTIIFSGILSYILFNHIPDTFTLIGSIIVILGGLLLAYSKGAFKKTITAGKI